MAKTELSPLAKQVIDRQEIEVELPASRFIQVSSMLSTRGISGARNSMICCAVMVLGLLLAVVTGLSHLYPITAAGVAIIVFAAIKNGYYSRANVPTERAYLAEKVVKLLERDLSAESKLYLNLYFLPTISDSNKVDKRMVGKKIDRSYYENTWFESKGRFTDGSKFKILVTDIVQRKFRKYKVKEKGLRVELLLVYPTKRYGSLETFAAQARSVVQLPKGTYVRSLKLRDRSIKLTVMISPSFGDHRYEGWYKTITMMLMSSYQILNLGKTVKRA